MADDAGSKTPFDKEQRIRGMEKRQTLLRWEDPIEHRIRALVLLARDKAAENTNKSELLAALVLAASEDPAELSRNSPGISLEQGGRRRGLWGSNC